MLTTTWCYISLLLAVAVYLVLGASNTSCPTGFYYNNTTSKCECNRLLEKYGLVCNQLEKRAYIVHGVCITSAAKKDSYTVGYCPLTLGNWENITNRLYSELPSDPDMLNATMCGPYNREGYLCGKCIDGYGLPVYSHDLKCVNCSRISTGLGISFYLLIVIVPLTLFFACVVLFRLNITSGPLLGYFMFCQVHYVNIASSHQYLFGYIEIYSPESLKVLFSLSLAIFEFWVLLFFKSLIPPFCISEKLSGVHIQLLGLVPATYLVFLVSTVCVVMELHARNYRITRLLWKPFSLILSRVNVTTVSAGNAIIRAFSTLIFLSSTTALYNTIALNSPTHVHSITGNRYTSKRVLYVDPTVSHYLLYSLIAVVPCIFLVLIPALLLCVYPTRIYRRLSQLISTRKQLAITAFAEALHNCLKDGLNGTRDYRALAGLIILAAPLCDMLILLVLKANIVPGFPRHYLSSYILFTVSLVLSYVRPCKSALANLSLSYHTLLLGLLEFGFYFWSNLSIETETLELTFVIIPFLSHVMVLFWGLYSFICYISFRYF